MQPKILSPRTAWLRGFTVVAVAALIGVAQTANADDAADIARLSIKFERPRTVTIYPTDSDVGLNGIPKSGRVYWYMPYTLTNNGPKADKFFVSVRAESGKDRKQRRYSDLALPVVERKIERIERRKLQSKVDLQGTGVRIAEPQKTPVSERPKDKLHDKEPGKVWKEYQRFERGDSKECVAIFNPLDPEASTITVRIYGLANDITVQKLGNKSYKVIERVYQLTFKRPSDEFYSSLDKFVLVEQKWVTEETPLK